MTMDCWGSRKKKQLNEGRHCRRRPFEACTRYLEQLLQGSWSGVGLAFPLEPFNVPVVFGPASSLHARGEGLRYLVRDEQKHRASAAPVCIAAPVTPRTRYRSRCPLTHIDTSNERPHDLFFLRVEFLSLVSKTENKKKGTSYYDAVFTSRPPRILAPISHLVLILVFSFDG